MLCIFSNGSPDLVSPRFPTAWDCGSRSACPHDDSLISVGGCSFRGWEKCSHEPKSAKKERPHCGHVLATTERFLRPLTQFPVLVMTKKRSQFLNRFWNGSQQIRRRAASEFSPEVPPNAPGGSPENIRTPEAAPQVQGKPGFQSTLKFLLCQCPHPHSHPYPHPHPASLSRSKSGF